MDTPSAPLVDELVALGGGTHARLFEHFGAQLTVRNGRSGAQFTVWAPHAEQVWVSGDFNGWSKDESPLRQVEGTGVWETFVPDVLQGAKYRYRIVSAGGAREADKADPFGVYHAIYPDTASIVWDLAYSWDDGGWMSQRGERNPLEGPVTIYELHLGSWMHADHGSILSYRQMAPKLAEYVANMGFTHVEFLPVMEHPFPRSWGYEPTGFFAPASRYGTPQDLMFLVDCLHKHGIGVILDWPSHRTAADPHGLSQFDGTPLFEDPQSCQWAHPGGNCFALDLERNEVHSFLLSSATFWLEKFHADGLHVDAVGAILFPGYQRQDAQWRSSEHIGEKSLRAAHFLQKLTEHVEQYFSGCLMTAEDSSGEPCVTWPVRAAGGLGFSCQRSMGWIGDTLEYIRLKPAQRKYHHDRMTRHYAFDRTRILAVSHDEILDGRRSLLEMMPGDRRQQFANLRALLGYAYALPGKKLLFMGTEFGSAQPWRRDAALDWGLIQQTEHAQMQRWVRDLNRLYAGQPALREDGTDACAFEWIDSHDDLFSVVSFVRRTRAGEQCLLAACNFTTHKQIHFPLGVPLEGCWKEIINSDAAQYGGSGCVNVGEIATSRTVVQGCPQSIEVALPALSIVLFEHQPWGEGGRG